MRCNESVFAESSDAHMRAVAAFRAVAADTGTEGSDALVRYIASCDPVEPLDESLRRFAAAGVEQTASVLRERGAPPAMVDEAVDALDAAAPVPVAWVAVTEWLAGDEVAAMTRLRTLRASVPGLTDAAAWLVRLHRAARQVDA